MSITISTEQQTDKAWLGHLFSQYRTALNGHSEEPIAQFRQKAYQQLESADFPTRRNEDWKYTDVQNMLKHRYIQGQMTKADAAVIEPFLIEGLDAVVLTFINGVLSPSLSQLDQLPKGIQVQPLKEAINDPAVLRWIEEQTAQEGSTKQNTFVPMNLAFAENGQYIKIESKAEINRPIHFLHLSIPMEKAHFAHPQRFVKVGKGAQATILESYHSVDTKATYLTNTSSWIDLEANANLHHYRLQMEGSYAFQVNTTFVRQSRDSRYSHYGVDLGGKMIRNNLSTELLDSNTETNYYGLYLARDRQHIDNQTFIDHAVPHCESNELYKGVLMDHARGVFNGKVLVRQDAQKTNAFQQNNSLVLSDDAKMNAKPQLEIYADDVKCSHGATIGQLDEAAIFYLQTRGISHSEAQNLLQQAFLGEVLEAMPHEAVAIRMQLLIDQKLNV